MMDSLLSSGECLHQGWLTKSPPLEKAVYPIFKAQWKRRWFVLQQQSGQYQLHYFDKKKSSLKGTINLDECEQVDIGLTVELGKQRFPHIFDIKTPHRLYYLAADTKEEMKEWVRMVCNACGFKPAPSDEDEDAACGFGESSQWPTSSRPVASTSLGSQTPSISNPYIHISSCYTGGLPPLLSPGEESSRPGVVAHDNSNETGDDSVFYPPEEPTRKTSSSSATGPSRPPKPSRLAAKQQGTKPPPTTVADNYANHHEMQTVCDQNRNSEISPEPLPRPPSTFKMRGHNKSADDASLNFPPPTVSRELKPGRKDFSKRAATLNPKSYSGALPGSQFATMGPGFNGGPPVARDLKPRDMALSELNLSSPPLQYPPPSAPLPKTSSTAFPFHSHTRERVSSSDASANNSDDQLIEPPLPLLSGGGAEEDEEEQIYFYMPSVSATNGSKYPVMIPADSCERPSVAYIDLDLPSTSGRKDSVPDRPDCNRGRMDSGDGTSLPSSAAGFHKPSSGIEYQKIDFVKTEAFKRMRHKVEEKYNQT